MRISVLAGTLALVAMHPLQAQDGGEGWRLAPETSLSNMLDCLEAGNRTLISAHRGGPSPGLPENAIETMDALITAVPAIMEIDVAQSPEGVLYLMHDDTLDRTTTGSGPIASAAWSTIETLYLRDEAGWQTPYRVPTLEAALDWARGRTVLQIDFKRSTSFESVIDVIRAKQSENSVVLIAYTVGQASRLHELAPEMLLSVSINSAADLAALRAAGIPDDRMVAFTGTRTVRPDLYAGLDEDDIEVIFGTLGRPPGSLDSMFDRFGTDERYAELGEGGVDIIATDRPREAAAALSEENRLPEAGQCGVNRLVR